MLKRLTLVCFSLLFSIISHGHVTSGDSLRNRLLYIQDSLRQYPEDELKVLLNLQNTFNSHSYYIDSSYAFLLLRIGELYSKQGDFIKSVLQYRKVISIIIGSIDKPFVNPDYLIKNYFRLYQSYDSLGRVSEMMEAIDSCISISIRRKIINLFYLAALYKKVEYLFDIGDYSRCIQYATTCEMAGKQYAQSKGSEEFNDGMEYVSSSLIWIVNAHLTIHDYVAAEKLLDDKLKDRSKFNLDYDLGAILEQMAMVQVARGDYIKALKFFNQSYFTARRQGLILSCRGILNNIGNIIYLKHEHNPDSALFYFRKANELKNKDNLLQELNSVETLNIMANTAMAYILKGRFDSAFIYFQYAFDQVKPGIREEELLTKPFNEFASQKKIGYLTGLLLDKADAYRLLFKLSGKTRDLSEAVRIYKITDQLLDRIKTEQSDMQSKLFWRSDSRRLYEHAIDACYSYSNHSDAFYFFEKSRAVLLNDQLNEQRWLGEENIQKLAQIKRKIIQLTKISDGLDDSSTRYNEVQTELLDSRQELDRLFQVIKNQDPLYFQNFINSRVPTIQDVNKTIIADHRALLEIFSGDSSAYIFLITADKSIFQKLDKKVLDSLSGMYINYISNASILNSQYADYTRVSRAIYQMIFSNARLPKGRIVISPDGQCFPFEALITNVTGSPDYFIYDYSVSYTYSAKYLMSRYDQSKNISVPEFLGIAPVFYPASFHLTELKGSNNSLSIIKSYFGNGSNLVYKDASKSGFMKRFSKFRIIQLYTHAIDSGKNGEPVIFFSDSSLYLSDLISEDKPVTHLIVLSACETGLGKLYKGEGVFSFSRGFASLGIPSSISNLWSVDEQSTYRITELFYSNLANHMPIDIALQRAKIEFIQSSSKKYQLPFFWAAPILIGNDDEILFSQGFSWKLSLLVLMTLSSVVFLAYIKFNSLKKRTSKRNGKRKFLNLKTGRTLS
jgi:CHAT domain-containing protein